MTIDEAVEMVLSNPRPLLLIDTCVLFDIVRAFERRQPNFVGTAQQLLQISASKPKPLHFVATYLVRHEWGQGITNCVKSAATDLAHLADRLNELVGGLASLMSGASFNPPLASATDIANNLRILGEAVLDSATEINRDEICVQKAITRVHEKQRPSHDGSIKDSIHLEHHLEFVRRLRHSGFTRRAAFISSDKRAFWLDSSSARIHTDLSLEFGPLNLEFYGNLTAGLNKLLYNRQ